MNFFSNQNNIRLISRCPVCYRSHDSARIKVLEESEEAHLVYLVCGGCGTRILALLADDFSALSSHGLVTELTWGEVKKFKKTPGVEINDVIDLHYLLNKERSRASALF